VVAPDPHATYGEGWRPLATAGELQAE